MPEGAPGATPIGALLELMRNEFDIVIVDTWSNDTHAPLHVYYYVDVATGEATPTVDFSEVESLDALFEPTESGIPMRFYSPWTASMSPKGDALILYNDLAGLSGVLTSPLPPTGELPQLDYISQIFNTDGVTRSSRADDGRVLIYNILFGTTEEE